MNAKSELDGRIVLVVDDHEDARVTLGDLLQMWGCVVLAAENGQDAIDLLDTSTLLPDVILLDLDMPVMGGREFLARKEGDAPWSAVPVIVMSGAADAEERLQGMKVAGFQRKPFRSADLLIELKAAVRTHR